MSFVSYRTTGPEVGIPLFAQSHSEVELEEEVKHIVDIEVHGGELQVNVEEPPPYVPPIPFSKRLEKCKVLVDTSGDSSPAEGETGKQLQQVQDLKPKQEVFLLDYILTDDNPDLDVYLLFSEEHDIVGDIDLHDKVASNLVIKIMLMLCTLMIKLMNALIFILCLRKVQSWNLFVLKLNGLT
ncbi:hypothetical protein LIER_09418 [Lithospermum erythrorhizon]|uniref:Uncharacterized protein n=1 Tax=Lithospermum erythrorhizon TaxID=34254 RepID=A0AAV3PGV4_LITER